MKTLFEERDCDLAHLNDLTCRPRRNRKSHAVRSLVSETSLSSRDFIYPLFVREGKQIKEPISSLPGIYRMSPDVLIKEVESAIELGIPAIALFPVIPKELKDEEGSEATNPQGILQKTVRFIKEEFPDICLIADVALDAYTSHGHDGVVNSKGEVLNDETVVRLMKMSVLQAQAGIDMVAPSDMMDGRVGAIRKALDGARFTNVSILAYSVKYASSFYGPYRDALSSSPTFGDKKTYQLDPANKREALREAKLDESEGADILMIKPATLYLDVIAEIKRETHLPIAAYHVSGEYACLKAAAQNGWINGQKALMESLLSIKRAGADMIITYGAKEAAQILREAHY